MRRIRTRKLLTTLGTILTGVSLAQAFLTPPRRSVSPLFVQTKQISDVITVSQVESLANDLLNRTEIGEWDEECFHDAEAVAEAIGEIHKWNSYFQSHRGAIMMERVIRRIVQEQQAGNPNADSVDSTAMYNLLIDAWARSENPDRAYEVLVHCQNVYESGDYVDPMFCGPEISAFNSVILAYAGSGTSKAPAQALKVLTQLYQWHREGRTTVAPNQETYAAVLRAYAKMGTREAPELVLKLLDHMENLAKHYPSVKPDYNGHNAYIAAVIDATQRGHLSPFDGANLAHKHLNRMLSSQDPHVRPDTWSFNMCLGAWSRSGSYEMVDRIETLIQQLEDYHVECNYSEKTMPNTNTYNILIACYGRSTLSDKATKARAVLDKMQKMHDRGGVVSVQPDTVTYNSLMNAIAKSGTADGPYLVEHLLNEMQELLQQGNTLVCPNSRSYNTCLDAWAKSGIEGSAERVMEWIGIMQTHCKNGNHRLQPNKWSYNAYLQALAKTGGSHIGDEAERILEEVFDVTGKGTGYRLKPDVLTMTNVIHCIALSGNSDSLERALKVLNRMEDMHAQGIGDVRPNLFTYNCVINAAAKACRPGKAKLALQVLRRMESASLRPQIISYNNVLNACAFSNHVLDDSRETLKIALSIMREAQEGPGATWITYQTVMRVIANNADNASERWRLTRELLDSCKKDKQLTRSVLLQVRHCLSPSQYEIICSEVIDPETRKLKADLTSQARKIKMTPKTRATDFTRL